MRVLQPLQVAGLRALAHQHLEERGEVLRPPRLLVERRAAVRLLAVEEADDGLGAALALRVEDDVQRHARLDQRRLDELAAEVDAQHRAFGRRRQQREQRRAQQGGPRHPLR